MRVCKRTPSRMGIMTSVLFQLAGSFCVQAARERRSKTAAGFIRCTLSGRRSTLERESVEMDKSVRVYHSHEEMKADEYRYWQSRPVWERMDAVEELIQTAYALKGWKLEPDVPRLRRHFV